MSCGPRLRQQRRSHRRDHRPLEDCPIPARPNVVEIGAPPADGADLGPWCARVGACLSRGDTVVADFAASDRADLCLVDALAHLHLHARRCGSVLRVRNAHPELVALWRFAGLGSVAPLGRRR